MTLPQIEQHVLTTLQNYSLAVIPDNPPGGFALCRLSDDLKIDSLAAAELMIRLDEILDVQIDYVDYAALTTLGDLTQLIHNKLNG